MSKTVVVDISHYTNEILAGEDCPLFEEAVQAGKVGALRAAYIMIWLACAESLKRRFREAQKRDDNAARIVGEIEEKEEQHKGVDYFVLTKAHEYGFVSDSVHPILKHIYEMRCLYGHPYGEKPSEVQISHAADMVVEHVLSKPVKLRHGFGDQLLKKLLSDPNCLGDQQTAVEAFTKDILPRLDEGIYGWFLNKYWGKLVEISEDSSVAVFFRRGIWFSRAMLVKIGASVFSAGDWHDKTSKFPRTLMWICSIADIFREIGERAQDSLVGLIITKSSRCASVLGILESLSKKDALTPSQKERFVERVSGMELAEISSSKLSLSICYNRLIEAMGSRNWDMQNLAIDFIISSGPDQIGNLDVNQQINLGRNLLQSAEGNAWSAVNFLDSLCRKVTRWPFNVIRGIALELFINEENVIRFKIRHFDKVLRVINQLPEDQQNILIIEISGLVNGGVIECGVTSSDRDKIIRKLGAPAWAMPLIESLRALELERD